MQEKFNIKGHVKIQKYNGNHELLQEWEGDNLVTLDGADFLSKRFTGDSSEIVKDYVIGYNSEVPRVTDDTADFLNLTPAAGVNISYSGWSKDNATLTYEFISPSGYHIGVWREAGLLTNESGVLFNRISLPEMSKQEDQYVIGSWKLSF